MKGAIVNVYLDDEGKQKLGIPSYTRGQAEARAAATRRVFGHRTIYRIRVREREA